MARLYLEAEDYARAVAQAELSAAALGDAETLKRYRRRLFKRLVQVHARLCNMEELVVYCHRYSAENVLGDGL